YGYGWRKFKHKSEQLITMTKTPNFVPIRNGEIDEFTEREILDICGYPPEWKTTGSLLQVWNRAGNSIMPHVSSALAYHIRDNILGKANDVRQVTNIPAGSGDGTNDQISLTDRLIISAPPAIVDLTGTPIKSSSEKEKHPIQLPPV